MAIAVFGALVSNAASFIQGMQISFIIAAVLLILAAVASIFLPRTTQDAVE